MKGYSKKIIIFALILLILAGAIVVGLKGFNVSLDLRAHDTLKFVFSQKFEMSDVDKVCKDVFKDKEYSVKTVEVFTDAIYVIAPTISESEEEALLTKLNDLYKKEENNNTETNNESEENSVEETPSTIYDKLEEGTDYKLYSDSKVRIRDIVKPYVLPSIISALIICVYIAIKYKKLYDGNFIKPVCETLGQMLVVLLTLLSIIAVCRIPFTSTVIPIVIFIMLACIVFKLACLEKKLEDVEE